MAKTTSTMLALGTTAPHFSLRDVLNGDLVTLDKATQAKAILVMFICNHCPYVKHINKELTRLANDYMNKDVMFFAINSNDIAKYPDDAPENMKKIAQEEHYPFPYLFDETQEVARAYQAACTPDFYIFDANLSLVYRGQLDDSRPGNNIDVTGNAVRHALDCLLINKPNEYDQKASLGCDIKWKS